jgi:CRISPR-associated exonuclease Cas4
MLLEDVYNKPVRYGFICNTSGLVVPLEITPNSRVFVKEMLEKMRLLVSSESMPKRASHKMKCIDCEFHNFCGDVR